MVCRQESGATRCPLSLCRSTVCPPSAAYPDTHVQPSAHCTQGITHPFSHARMNSARTRPLTAGAVSMMRCCSASKHVFLHDLARNVLIVSTRITLSWCRPGAVSSLPPHTQSSESTPATHGDNKTLVGSGMSSPHRGHAKMILQTQSKSSIPRLLSFALPLQRMTRVFHACRDTHTLPQRSVLDSYSLCIRTHVLACQRIKHTHTHTHTHTRATFLDLTNRVSIPTAVTVSPCAVRGASRLAVHGGFTPPWLSYAPPLPPPLCPSSFPLPMLNYVLRSYSCPPSQSCARTRVFSATNHTSTECEGTARHNQATCRLQEYRSVLSCVYHTTGAVPTDDG